MLAYCKFKVAVSYFFYNNRNCSSYKSAVVEIIPMQTSDLKKNHKAQKCAAF